jgi:hypothetical protein
MTQSDLILTPTPICCDYAKQLIMLTFETYYVKDKKYFYKNKPFWVVRTSFPINLQLLKDNKKNREIKYCPRCRQNLPDIRLKKDRLKKVMTIIDGGGDCCDTCNNRLIECECTRPENLWEIIIKEKN